MQMKLLVTGRTVLSLQKQSKVHGVQIVVDVVVDVVVVVEEVVVDVVVLVVVVVLLPGFFSDGTHSSRRWISSGWAGPNWLFVNVCTVPKAEFFVL